MHSRFFICLFLISPTLAYAGGFESPGVGAKALSMGGAFVGLADDWTATYWNPAGLAQLEGTGVGVTINQLFSDTKAGNSIANPIPPFTQQNIQRGDPYINLGGEPTQFNVNDSRLTSTLPATAVYHRQGPWTIAGSLHLPLGYSSSMTDNSIPGFSATFKQEAYLVLSGVSFAYACSSFVLLGAGFHVLTAHLERDADKSGPGYDFSSSAKGDDPMAPEGVLGLLVKPSTQFQIGAVYRTPATLHVKGQATVSDTRFPIPTPFGTLTNESSHFTQDIYNPATYGVGIAYRPWTRWTFTADWQGTDWRPTREKITFDTPGLIFQNQDSDAHWKFTSRLRAGTQWEFHPRWVWRAGWSHDPQAMPDDIQSLTNNVDIPHNFYATGFGWTATQTLSFDLGYQYGYGQRTINGTPFRLVSHSLLAGMTYRFR